MTWHLASADLFEKEPLCQTLIQVHRDLYSRYFRGEMGVNGDLPIQIRAYRTIEYWHVCLILTPWMLARLYVPAQDPGLSVPRGWSADECSGKPYVVIGPLVEIGLLGGKQKAYLNFDAKLGHYLLQPLVQAMESYASADEVFKAWNDVIEVRDANIRKAQKDCPMQREVSRREFLARVSSEKLD